MMIDSPPAIVYEIPSSNFAVQTAEANEKKKQKEPICVMAFGKADPNLGVYEDNTKVHFYDHFAITMNAKIVKAVHAGINPQVYSSWVLYYSGVSSVVVEFDLQKKDLKKASKNGLGLYLTHLSSDIHTGNYDSAIRILVNGKVLVEKYVPASHDWIAEDRFDLASFLESNTLQVGKNTVEIQLHADARSNYWIHQLMVK